MFIVFYNYQEDLLEKLKKHSKEIQLKSVFRDGKIVNVAQVVFDSVAEKMGIKEQYDPALFGVDPVRRIADGLLKEEIENEEQMNKKRLIMSMSDNMMTHRNNRVAR